MRDYRRLGLAAVITACIFWGGSFYFGKIALRELTAMEVVWWRFILATTVLAPVLAMVAHRRRARSAALPGRIPNPPRYRDFSLFLLNALLMVPVQFVLQFEGLARTSASSASLLVGVFAPLMALGGVLVARERLSLSGWMAIFVSSVGVGVMVGLPGEGRTLLGDLMVVGSLVCAVGMVLVTQRLLRRYDALSVTVWSMGMGVVLLLPWIYFVQGWPSASGGIWTWSALFGLGFGCTAVAFTLWNWGLHYVPASHAGVFVNLEPLIGTVLGVVLLHDALTGGLVVGGSLILAGAMIITWPRSSQQARPGVPGHGPRGGYRGRTRHQGPPPRTAEAVHEREPVPDPN